MSYRILFVPCCAFVLGSVGGLPAQESPVPQANKLVPEAGSGVETGSRNPFTGPEDVQQGRQLIRAQCSRCHGIEGKGGKGPDLTDGVFRHGSTDEEILRNIQNGIPGTGMPGVGEGFGKWTWQIISYLRAEAAERTQNENVLTGDPARGGALFATHKCNSCHWTGSSGGRRGSNLSRSRATVDYVRRAIIDPDSQIDGTHQPVVMVMKSGSVREGMRLHENSYNVLIMDSEDNLQSIPKNEIDDLRLPHKSLMPNYSKLLTPKDLEDLVAYVFSLKEELPR